MRRYLRVVAVLLAWAGLAQARGLLIYMSSGGGRTILPFLGAYSASKFALEALAESYHYQLYSLGIDTVIVQPGAHATPVSTNSRSASEADRGAGYGPVATQMDQAIARFHAFFAFIHDHVDQDITRKHTPFDFFACALANFNFGLGRDNHLQNAVRHAHRFRAMFDIFLNFVFHTRIAVDHKPFRFNATFGSFRV